MIKQKIFITADPNHPKQHVITWVGSYPKHSGEKVIARADLTIEIKSIDHNYTKKDIYDEICKDMNLKCKDK